MVTYKQRYKPKISKGKTHNQKCIFCRFPIPKMIKRLNIKLRAKKNQYSYHRIAICPLCFAKLNNELKDNCEDMETWMLEYGVKML